MSSVYVLEPPTKGKVILNTTYGPVDIELWPKEAPKAVRNFVQLCLESYYDNTIFHRLIKGFLVQGGDPTGTGTGGESIYGGVFPDEFHSRLRFNHRGLVACANAGSPHSNGSQFFISLDKCEWLDRKNTIFGKVTGDSIYNLLSLGEVETDKDDRPLDPPPRIKSVEVLWNPFEDIIPRGPPKPIIHSTTDTENKDSKKKAVKKLNLLSFGEEAEEEEKELVTLKQKIKSSHDVLNDPRLLKEEIPSAEVNASEAKRTRDMQLSVREALSSKREESLKDVEAEVYNSDDEDDTVFDARMRQQILKRRKELGDQPPKQRQNGSSSPKDRQIAKPRSNVDFSDDDQPRVEKLSLKKKGIGSEARAQRVANADVDLQLYTDSQRERLLTKQKKRRIQGREDEVLAKLEKFKSAISTKSSNPSNVSIGGNDEDLSDWQTVRLKFASGPGKDRMSRNEDLNDYVVHDPLLEKGKEKFNRMQAKQKRRDREWAGKSLT
ncbi:putative peptidyl-prolyl cis-trans isomerase [Tripterygium wilfordii]|uniref:Putative peptidyl-prolyl cis-trans isomerase n=1 Tax=Tripterygium wilfordii TaxID=458696 RepID=A0A7J7DPS2_TRIWF|nr:peptidyl-prolyl cis-trans isomerase CYP57 [Tripterygium wilfordii]KAF5748338.1 putative peptidyl-prolyl cis-trans isomerase [Tripterygium wilfordii]